MKEAYRTWLRNGGTRIFHGVKEKQCATQQNVKLVGQKQNIKKIVNPKMPYKTSRTIIWD